MAQNGLGEICDTISSIIDKLNTGEETCRIGDGRSLSEIIEYLTDFNVELRELDARIAKEGNTPALLKEVLAKYTELWLFQMYYYIESLPKAIGALNEYANQ
jgi:hypothetical protein